MTLAFIILTILNTFSEMIELTYDIGKSSAPYIKMAVAFVITVAVFTYENRHRVGKAFIYESPSRLKAPRYIKAPRIRGTIALA